MDLEQFCATMETRARIYRMLASLYLTELTAAQVDELAQADFSPVADLEPRVDEGVRNIRRALRHVNSSTREDLAVDYAHSFLAAGSTKHEKRAVPIESVHTSTAGLMMGEAYDQVYKAMLKEGVLPDAALRIPDDHLSFELEFMALMAERAVAAVRGDDRDEALRLVDAAAAFRRDHLANWMGDFRAAVERCCRTKFYLGVAQLTDGFVALDAELLDECRACVAA